MLAVILAAGRGTRLGSLTAHRSKAMLPVVGKPMLERVMMQIAAAGIDQFLLVVSPEDSEIVEYFNQREDLFGSLRFAYQDHPLGMGHALLSAAEFIESDFLLAACDNLVSSSHIHEMLLKWTALTGVKALLSVMSVASEQVISTAIVDLEGDTVTGIIEKPRFDEVHSLVASLPLYIFTPDIISLLRDVKMSIRGEIELQDAIQTLTKSCGNVIGVETQRRLTLTKLDDYLYINLHYLRSGDFISRSFSSTKDSILIPPYYIGSDVELGDGCVIGPNVFIDSESKLTTGTMVSNAVVLGQEIFRYD
jgi:dTDP-glucose pyrophosphorylase